GVGGCRLLNVVAIKQRYPGHARQAGNVAAMCRAGAYLGRLVIVVDDDIDVTDLDEVMWAVCTRSDPERSIALIKWAWSGPLDPAPSLRSLIALLLRGQPPPAAHPPPRSSPAGWLWRT